MEQARARARARARDYELDLSDLRSSDFEGLEGGITVAVGVETGGQDSGVADKADGGVGDKEVEVEALASPTSLASPASPASPASSASPVSPASPASPALQLRPKRARKMPARYQG